MELALILEKVRKKNPLIHNITNVVVTNFTANGLLALGASPVMAYAAEEVAEMAQMAGALVLNIGTLNQSVVDSMLIAGNAAGEKGVPIILDPVGAGATHFRTQTAQMLMEELNISVLRGNAAEIANVAGEQWSIKGVDGSVEQGDIVGLAKSTAQRFNTVVAITGKEDIISDGEKTFIVKNGHALLTKVTGAGCLLTSIIGAFAAVEKDVVLATTAAIAYYGVAAEKAALIAAEKGPGSFQIELLNQLERVSSGHLKELASIEIGGVSNGTK